MKKTINSKLTTCSLVDNTSTQAVIESRHSSSGNATFTTNDSSSGGTAAAFLGRRLFLLSMLVLTTFAATGSSAQAQSITSGSVYRLRNQCSNKVLDVFGGNTSDGTAAIQWTEHNAGNQQFKVEATDSGYYRLVAQHSQKVLDVQYSQTADGTVVWQWPSNNTAAQHWKIVTNSSDGYWQVESRLASNKVLDVNAASTADGAKVQLWTSNNTCAQRWKFELVGGGATPTPTPEAAMSKVTYTGDFTTNFLNPERGFYRPFKANGNDTMSPLKLSELQKVRTDGMSLAHRYYLLSEFRDKPISQSYLDMISSDFSLVRQAGVKVAIRFAYNWMGGGPDAPRDRILLHLEQLKPVLQSNYDVIAYMDAGLIGNWGEWHSSTNKLLEGEWGVNVGEDARAIVAKILSVLPTERMVTIRYNHQKQGLFNRTEALTEAEAHNGSGFARAGHHNDAFRASIVDGGTYGGNNDLTIVNQEKTWLNQDNKYVVQSGEPGWPSDQFGLPEWDDCPGSLEDFARMRWSSISINNADASSMYQGWIDQGCMPEIQRRLGYRFRLLESNVLSAVRPGAELKLDFTLTNDGWAAPYNPRPLEVRLRHKSSGQVLRLRLSGNRSNHEDPRLWLANGGDQSKSYTVSVTGGVPTSAATGEYEVEVALPDPVASLSGDARYSIRMANAGGVWRSETGSNSLQQAVQVTASAGGSIYTGSQWFE